MNETDRRDAIVPGLLIPAGLFPVITAVSGADGSWPLWRTASLVIGASIVVIAIILLVRAVIRPIRVRAGSADGESEAEQRPRPTERDGD